MAPCLAERARSIICSLSGVDDPLPLRDLGADVLPVQNGPETVGLGGGDAVSEGNAGLSLDIKTRQRADVRAALDRSSVYLVLLPVGWRLCADSGRCLAPSGARRPPRSNGDLVSAASTDGQSMVRTMRKRAFPAIIFA